MTSSRCYKYFFSPGAHKCTRLGQKCRKDVGRHLKMKRAESNKGKLSDDEWQPAKVPDTTSLKLVRQAASACTACPLYKNATQTVFGDGPRNPPMMLVGEQPGDSEDLSGKPFVGPAGKIMDRALEEAGINRKEVYVTNVVKHFKWEPRGKRRIHQRPNSRDIAACRPWLEAGTPSRCRPKSPGRSSWRFCRSGHLRAFFPGHPRAWQSSLLCLCQEGGCHGASFVTAAAAG